MFLTWNEIRGAAESNKGHGLMSWRYLMSTKLIFFLLSCLPWCWKTGSQIHTRKLVFCKYFFLFLLLITSTLCSVPRWVEQIFTNASKTTFYIIAHLLIKRLCCWDGGIYIAYRIDIKNFSLLQKKFSDSPHLFISFSTRTIK